MKELADTGGDSEEKKGSITSFAAFYTLDVNILHAQNKKGILLFLAKKD